MDWLTDWRARIHIRALRLHLETGAERTSVPVLRGIWGSVLNELDPPLYAKVFAPDESSGGIARYLFRPALPAVRPTPALEWLLFHVDDEEMGRLLQSWHIALLRGVGKSRTSAYTRWILPLDSTGAPSINIFNGFTLDVSSWPLPVDLPCRLRFISPVRLKRGGSLIFKPTLHDLVIAAARRLSSLAVGKEVIPRQYQNELLAICDRTPVKSWQGEPVHFVHYSASQKQELDLTGVAGTLDLPEGPGGLGDLLAAAWWTHIGKGTVMGLGQFIVETLY